ncbi:MAG: hypothetical protein ACFFCK_00145, partial [Promethearchaeota archaeon]
SYAASCRMILICNYSSRIIPPIQSRCAIFRFPRLDSDAIGGRVQFIAKKEKVALDATGKDAILYLAEGDMRAAINLLQAASSTGDKVTETVVYAIAGKANPKAIRDMLDLANEGNYETSLETLRSLIYQQGVSPVDLARQMHREVLRMEISVSEKMAILEKTAEVEFRIGEGASGEIQISALLAYIGLEQSQL